MYPWAHNRPAHQQLWPARFVCATGTTTSRATFACAFHVHGWLGMSACASPGGPALPVSLSISHLCPASSISLGKVSGTILLTCHFRSNDFEWKARTSRNLHGPLRWDREKGIQWEGVCRGIGGRESHNSTRMQSVKICKRRWMSIKLIKLATGIEFARRQQAHVAYYS